jgi:hypothetical protein
LELNVVGLHNDGNENKEKKATLAEEPHQPVVEANCVPSSKIEHKHY